MATILPRESRCLEYKQEASNLKKIAQTVIAFANGIGGELIIGVKDKSRRVLGIAPILLEELLDRIPISIADQVRPPIFPLIYTRMIDGAEVLVVQVYPGMQKPYYLAVEGVLKGVYIRVGAHTRRAEGGELEELSLFSRRMTYDEAPVVDCPLSDLDLTPLPKSLRSEKGLLSLDVISRDPHTGHVHPTKGGVLMLHSEPQRFIPEAEIIVSRMRGTHGRDTAETHLIQGSLPEQADRCAEILLAWLSHSPQVRGTRYKPTASTLPSVAIREALLNALCHRQYSIRGACKVALYPDRLEIFSPGVFAGPFVVEHLGDGSSYIRNKVVGQLARRLFLIEKRGTGIKAIFDSMQAAGLKPPEFEEGANWVKVTLRTEKADQTSSLNNADDIIMDLFLRKPSIKRPDVEKALSVSRATAVTFLDGLIKQGRIKRVGRGPQTRYEVVGV
jgi:ATP-dependent DNA helicase RecG